MHSAKQKSALDKKKSVLVHVLVQSSSYLELFGVQWIVRKSIAQVLKIPWRKFRDMIPYVNYILCYYFKNKEGFQQSEIRNEKQTNNKQMIKIQTKYSNHFFLCGLKCSLL